MMAQPFPTHAGIAPGHPGMPHGHPMAGMQHPGAGHMGGQPQHGMMQGMHPGVSGPQVTQGPMVTGMPPGAGTPAPGPMHSGGMAMAHLGGPQQAMFQQPNPQMNFGQMQITPQQQQLMARQRMVQQMQQQNQQQGMHMMPNGQPAFSQAQLNAQMKMGMIPPQMQMQMQAGNPSMQNFQHVQQQRMIQAHQAQAHHAAQLAASRAQQTQQMQMSRSQEQATQPPQQVPTPAPQPPPQPSQQPQPTPQPQPQPKPTPQQPQAQPVNNQPQQPQQQPQQQQSQPQSQQQQQQQNQSAAQAIKTSEAEEESSVKQQQDLSNSMMISDISKSDILAGQCILRLIQYQNNLANPERPNDLDYWEETMTKYFSPVGSLRQQLYSIKSGGDKSFQLQFPSLARYFYSHFACGVKQIFLQSYDHNENKLPNGGVLIMSSTASLTYVFQNDIRVTTTGQLRVTFDDMQKIEQMNISTTGWQEYIPRSVLLQPQSPEVKQSPKITNKNLKRAQGKPTEQNTRPIIPQSGVGEFGVPNHIFQFLEVSCEIFDSR